MPTSPLPPDPYKTLGVAKDATISAVRIAYRKLVLLSHPDKFPDEAVKAQKAEEFHRVQQAYEILSDDKKRERYDAQVRLAELKAERFREEANSPKRQESHYSPRPSAERVWTSQPIFEEIRPKARYYEDGPPPPPPLSRPEPRYEEHRPRARDYEDYDDCIPLHGTTKKAGASRVSEVRVEESSNRSRNHLRVGIAAVKAAAAFKTSSREYQESRRVRDKGRRVESQSKRHVRSSFEGDTGSETEPEIVTFMTPSYTSHKKESSRSYEDDRHHSRRKHESRASSPDRETKAEYKVHSAAEYIAKSKAASVRRPSVGRSQSISHTPPAPPPPQAPVPVAVEDVTRSSARRNATSKSSKSSKREVIEIVDPPRRRDYESEAKIPDLKTSVTSPTSLKPPRSATMDTRGSDRSRNTMRRSATSPLVASVSASHSQKSSKLGRDTHDSGYSSPGTPDNQGSRSKTTTAYRVRKESDSDSDAAGPRYVLLDPEHRRPQAARESSLHNVSHRSERATTSGGSARHAAARSHTEEHVSHHPRPATLSRGATDRPGMLYGELRGSPEPRVQYSNVQTSQHYGPDDVQYASYSKRPSPSDNDHRHAYTHSRRGSVPIRPGRAQEVKGF